MSGRLWKTDRLKGEREKRRRQNFKAFRGGKKVAKTPRRATLKGSGITVGKFSCVPGLRYRRKKKSSNNRSGLSC